MTDESARWDWLPLIAGLVLLGLPVAVVLAIMMFGG